MGLSCREGSFVGRARRLHQALDHALDRHAFGLGAVVEQNAMAQRGTRERVNVFDA